MIGLGYGLAAFAKLLTAWQLVLLARCTDRLGKGIRGAPRDAPAGRRCPVSPRGGWVFGLHRTADTAGAVIGPLAGL